MEKKKFSVSRRNSRKLVPHEYWFWWIHGKKSTSEKRWFTASTIMFIKSPLLYGQWSWWLNRLSDCLWLKLLEFESHSDFFKIHFTWTRPKARLWKSGVTRGELSGERVVNSRFEKIKSIACWEQIPLLFAILWTPSPPHKLNILHSKIPF